jgi:antitoxin MazE
MATGPGGVRFKTLRKGARKSAAGPLRRSAAVARWGNSLGIRIPQEAVERLGLRPGGKVSVEVRGDAMTIRPLRKKWTEAELLEGVTPDMVGGEVDWGPPVGREVG